MSQTTISEPERSYSIRKADDVFRYRVTVPNTVFESAGIEQGTDLGLQLESIDNKLVLSYTTDIQGSQITVSASKHTSGELSIPSSIGAAADLSEHSITWTLVEDESEYVLQGVTSKQLDNYTTEDSVFVQVNRLKHVEQEIDTQESHWNQEHFQLYLNVIATEQFTWEDEIQVALHFVSIDGDLSILFTPEIAESNQKTVKRVTTTGEYQRDKLVYIPNDIVRALNLIDTELSVRRSRDKTQLFVTKL